jgi:hypothetical protein
MKRIKKMFSRRVNQISGVLLAGGLSFLTTPAMAVPGWADASLNLRIPVAACQTYVQNSLRTVTHSQTATETFSTMGSITKGFDSDTGYFVYCLADSRLVCNRPSSTLAIIAFSDDGSGIAATKRDRVLKAIGNPQLIDCNP